MRRILVLRGGALGDFIVTLPALALLRQRWPAAEIELVGNATAAALARTRGLLNAVHSQHDRRWSALYGRAPLPADLAAWLADFDLVLNYWPDPEAELQRRFPVRPGQVFLTAAALPECAPAAAHYCRPLAQLGLNASDTVYPLATHVGSSASDAAPIVIHPGSGSPRKNWPGEKWRTLLDDLASPVSLVLGEAEGTRWRELDLPRFTRLENRPLEELVAHFATCRLFLGHDSGISHLAAACGAPCVLLFGPTDPAIWAPPVPHVRVIRHAADLNSISLDEVRQALAPALGRRA